MEVMEVMEGDEIPRSCRLLVLPGFAVRTGEGKFASVSCALQTSGAAAVQSDNWITTPEGFHLALCLFLLQPRRLQRNIFRAKSRSLISSFLPGALKFFPIFHF